MNKNSLELITGSEEVELAFVDNEDKIYLASSGTTARWPSKILREGKAVIRLYGELLERNASLVSEPEYRRKIIDLFTVKYGKEKTERWYSSSSRVIELEGFPGDVNRRKDDYTEWLEAEFDSIASNYDEHIFGNEINFLLRERSLALMDRVFVKPSRLLEIGCGTGTETIELLKKGHSVIAADISSKMLDIVLEKARKIGLDSSLTTVKVNGEEIEKLTHQYGEHSFDGIYSTYGAMNCIRDLGVIPLKLHSLLKDDGNVVMGIYNRFCAPEIAGYLIKLKPKSAFTRFKTFVPEGESRFCIDVFAYSMPEIIRLFHPYFKTVYREGVPVVVLPSNFVKYVRMFSGKLDELKKIDSWLGKRWPFSMLGDHFLLVMKPLVLAS